MAVFLHSVYKYDVPVICNVCCTVVIVSSDKDNYDSH